MGEKEKKEQQEQIKPQEQKKETEDAVSETWAEETMQELLDFWEEQGVYIREWSQKKEDAGTRVPARYEKSFVSRHVHLLWLNIK